MIKIFGFHIFKSKEVRFAKRSHLWSNVRKQHLEQYPFCAACGKSKKVEVHHIEPVHLQPSKELDPSNLITLCDDPCHLIFGHLMDYKSWNISVVQDSKDYYVKKNNRPYKN